MAAKYKDRLTALLLFSAIMILQGSCSKMNDLHDIYLKKGETIYVSRLDTAVILPGKERVLLRYVNKDPKVTKLLVYWRSRADSIMLDIPENSLNDTISAFIENLPEDNHTFELVTLNKDSEYKSIKYELNSNVYGERFQSSLLNRAAGFKEFLASMGKLTIKWSRAPQYAIASDISYTNVNGDRVVKRIPVSETSTEFTDVAGEIEYRTLFLPAAAAIDTFYTVYSPLEPVVIEGTVLDKSKFKRWNPAGIPYNAYNIPDWWIENAWDNTITKGFANFDLQFTFDMGQTAKLSQFIMNTRSEANLIYNHAHPRKFQIWGSNNPDVNADFSGWTLLGEFVSVKPSGSPLGTVTPADIQNAHVDGEKYVFPSNVPPVRYIRFVCQETWGKIVAVQFMEMTLWGTKID